MRTRLPTILITLLVATVALAGCTSGDADTDSINADVDVGMEAQVSLGAGEGAISGLIVDDNYRPVQLKEDWGNQVPGDFQDVGFVLVLETGQRYETTSNGEFTVLPVKPGTYTLRVAADNHEAIDGKVTVVAGEYAEITLEARRQYSGGGTLISQEQVLFMSCVGNFYFFAIALASVASNGCGDLSGDSSRFDFYTDLSPLKEDVRGMVTEFRGADEWLYDLVIRGINGYGGAPDDTCHPSYCYFARPGHTEPGTYLKAINYPDLQTMDDGTYLQDGQEGYCKIGRDPYGCERHAFDMTYGFQTAMFTSHPNEEYFSQTCGVTEPVRTALDDNVGVIPYGCGGVGIKLGLKAQLLQNVFLYELPDEGIEDYCALCDDADIPE